MSELEAYEGRLADLATLQAGWNSYHSAAIKPEAVEAARALVKRLAGHPRIDVAHLFPMGNGGIQLESFDSREWEIECHAEDNYGIWFDDPETDRDDLSLDDVVAMLNELLDIKQGMDTTS